MQTTYEFCEAVETLDPLGKDLHYSPDIKTLEQELKLRQSRIDALNAISQLTPVIARIKSQEDVDRVLEQLLSEAIKLSHASRGLIVLIDEKVEDSFTIHASAGMETNDSDDVNFSRSLIKQILERSEGVITTNIQADERFIAGESLLATNVRSVMATPIKNQDDVIGAIYVDSELSTNIFGEDDLEIFSAFANQTAVALSLATSLKAQRELYMQSILALVHAVEAADTYTAGHSQRVGYYAKSIAEALGFPEKEVELLLFAGYLHDVGKIALQTNVGKASPLTDEEWQEMCKHPIYGERILRNSPALAKILPAVRNHHERWDGKGYPDSLIGKKIHPYARIIAVADSFDAMTTNRPYRKSYSLNYALTEIRENIDRMYERAVAEAFLKAFEKGKLKLADKTRADETIAQLMNF